MTRNEELERLSQAIKEQLQKGLERFIGDEPVPVHILKAMFGLQGYDLNLDTGDVTSPIGKVVGRVNLQSVTYANRELKCSITIAEPVCYIKFDLQIGKDGG